MSISDAILQLYISIKNHYLSGYNARGYIRAYSREDNRSDIMINDHGNARSTAGLCDQAASLRGVDVILSQNGSHITSKNQGSARRDAGLINCWSSRAALTRSAISMNFSIARAVACTSTSLPFESNFASSIDSKARYAYIAI